MNKIIFDIISPHWEDEDEENDFDKRYVSDAQISIIIDGKDLLKEFEHMGRPRFAGIDPETFLFRKEQYELETNKLNGTLLIGVCNECFFEWCDDLLVEISTESNIVKWIIVPYRNKEYLFDINDYAKEIVNLYKKFNSYEWEDKNLKIKRLCNEYIKEYKTKNGIDIEGVRILCMLDEDGNDSDKLSNEMEIFFYGQAPIQKVEWDGETLESVLKNLKTFAEQNLIKYNKTGGMA
jgi:hypothetical protein